VCSLQPIYCLKLLYNLSWCKKIFRRLFLVFLGKAGSSKTPAPTSVSSPVSNVNETLTIDDADEDEGGLAEETSSQQKNQSTPKQDELSKQINIENEILVVLYKKKELNQLTENDRGEIKTRKENLEKLKKNLEN